MSKKTTKPAAAGDAPKPITLIVTIYPPKKNVRHVMVSGAPEGEMPLLFTGIFQDRHALLDQAFAGVLKREPQTVTLKADKSKSVTADPDAEEPGNREPDEDAASDQLVSDDGLPSPVGEGQGEGESVPVSPSTSSEDLPQIDGDTNPLEAAIEELKADRADTTDEEDDNG